ncbi:type I DNA topoisomerase [uncultured Bifidobacterium sp.]|uniref:type I DNA topoisomerase n=1 Tax=uncultured Bifidobacterium sp. TaxID=165187 RepID=UPI0028DB1503|nr:type I DNA topoisomerase [uncultured Bifidobacterium sp.]
MTGGTKLVIVESPTKARKIGGYLGDGYTVMASVGHIRDLAQPSEVPADKKKAFGRFGVDVDDGFEPYYVVGPEKRKTVADLRAALKKADELFLATDEDREGEAIAWHLVQTLRPKVPVRRMVFHEITPEAIRASLGHTRDVDDHMVDAQETRRVLDRLYGYELSPVLWRKVGPGLSAGRVQSVATRLIVERERERMAFVRASYWDVTAELAPDGRDAADAADGDGQTGSFRARMVGLGGRRLAAAKDFAADGTLTPAGFADNVLRLDESGARGLAKDLLAVPFTVSSVESKPYRRRPQPPFTTSTLQQAAGNRLSMGSRQTMRAAQGLYENGFITYMRTDSVTLSHEAIDAARNAVEFHFGSRFLSDSPRQYATTSAGAQEAHECIRPAGARFRDPKELEGKVPPDQLRLYTLIWRRTLASQMADAVGSTATVRLAASAGARGEALFQASGTVIEFPGFLRAMGDHASSSHEAGHRDRAAGGRAGAEAEGAALPPMSEGDVMQALGVEAEGHETQPPARYTEASLVKTLEAREIGRPSTYASIISTIIDRGYVYERGRALIPSWLAFAVTRLLETKFPTYVDYRFTADMENGLDRIAHGEETGRDWLTRFYFGSGDESASTSGEAHEGLQRQVAQLGEIDARAINTIDIGDGIHVRVGRYGPYLEDVSTPDPEGNPRHASIPDGLAPDELTVDKAREILDSNAGGPRVLGTDPDTGGTVEVRVGRFGPYVVLVPPEKNKDDDASGVEPSAPETAARAPEAPMETSDGRRRATTSRRGSGSAGSSSTDKPRMASLFSSMDPATLTLDDALRLLGLPRVVGSYEQDDGKGGEAEMTVTASNGRYGPYLTRTAADGTKETRSLSSQDQIFSMGIDEAKELFAQPKYGRGRGRAAAKPPLRELGADPDTGRPVVIKDGFYGAYITDGETNRTLPKQYAPDSIEPSDAFRLLAEKRAAGPTKRRRSSSSKSAKTSKSAKSTGRTASTRGASSASKSAKTSKSGTSRTTRKGSTTGAARSRRASGESSTSSAKAGGSSGRASRTRSTTSAAS